ncbi:MAG: ATP-binding protein [Halioglobus sp.]
MKLFGNLFFKMFVGFWLATVAIAASWMLSNEYFEERADHAANAHDGRKPPHRYMLRTIYTLQNAPDEELQALLEQSNAPGEVRIYLLDAQGNDYLGRELPDIVVATATQLERRRRVSRREEGQRYVAHRVYRPELGKMRAVFAFPPPPSEFVRVLGTSPALRIFLAVGISGLVCLFLSRLLTHRITALRAASQSLANGNLDTRAPTRPRGGDETDQLARDFNTMADQLQERILGQKQLLSDVSHELRSPLARLHVALALAQKEHDGTHSEAHDDHLQRIEREANRLEQLIAQLLTSQTETHDLDQHIDLHALLTVVTQDAQFEGSGKQQHVTFASEVEEAIVIGKGDLLHKCFDNLVRNALTYSPEESTISVRLVKAQAGDLLDTSSDNPIDNPQDNPQENHSGEATVYEVIIQDEGPGVPEEDLGRIFNAFYRVDSARARESGGYGLGLAIAKRAAHLHAGSIEAHNTHPGLRVTVTLPSGHEQTVAP